MRNSTKLSPPPPLPGPAEPRHPKHFTLAQNRLMASGGIPRLLRAVRVNKRGSSQSLQIKRGPNIFSKYFYFLRLPTKVKIFGQLTAKKN